MTVFGFAIVWGCAIYHFFVGVLAMTSVEFMRKAGKSLYNIKLPETLNPQCEYTWKPLGAYAIVIGAFSLRAVLVDDIIYQTFLIRMLCVLFVLRAVARWYYRDLFTRAFAVTFRRSLVNISFNFAVSGALWWFGIKA